MSGANSYPIDLGTNYRQRDNSGGTSTQSTADITVIADGGSDVTDQYDPESGTIQIPTEDGSVDIVFGAGPAPPKKSERFSENIAELLSESELSQITEKLLLGIEQDEQSRMPWLENMSNAIGLLGLQIKTPAGAAASAATPVEGTSTIDNPLLLEAVLRFQANARGELLPSDGPVKVRNDGEGNSISDRLAEALEKDMNHYLTKVAKEYYPDTDRMLLQLGFCGISFKKGYHDPIKRRPVIVSIDAKDLIVSNASTDLESAGRVTHRLMMRPSVLKRMQLLGVYRDVYLPTQGTTQMKNPVDTKIDQIQGIAPQTYMEPDDQDRELYECYCEIDIPGFEHKMDGKSTGLPLPYKVTIDKDARRALEIRRNWDEEDDFCLAINRIIAFTFIPGLGFYGIGLLNVLGNATKAVTAAWRLMIDAGMFSNFPGFLYVKSLAKQLTNQFRIPPGGGMPIDTVGQSIRDAVMPLPYKEASPVFIQFMQGIEQSAQRVGGTAELQIGEGKQDAPVGTTLAMIEQATKLMSAVHKRLHQAQGAEFDMLKDMLKEDPSSLWRHNKKSKVLELLNAEVGNQPVEDAEDEAESRHHALFIASLNDCELVPAADPNTSSQTERYLKVQALRQMAMTNPGGIDLNKVDEYAMQTMGIDDPQQFFKPPPDPNAPTPPAPEQITAMATMTAAQARMSEAQTKAADAQVKAKLSQQSAVVDAQTRQQDAAAKEKVAALGVARELVIHNADQQAARYELGMDAKNQQADRDHEQNLALMGHAADARQADLERQHASAQAAGDQSHEAEQQAMQRQHEGIQSTLDRQHEGMRTALDVQHEGIQGEQDRNNQLIQSGIEQKHAIIGDHLARQHEAEQAELARQHEMKQNELDRQNAAKVAAARPKPAATGKK